MRKKLITVKNFIISRDSLEEGDIDYIFFLAKEAHFPTLLSPHGMGPRTIYFPLVVGSQIAYTKPLF